MRSSADHPRHARQPARHSDPARFRFGAFTLEEASCELRNGDTVVPLQPQPFRLLAYLLRKAHRVISKEELLREVWPDAVVSEAALATALNAVRRALGDDGMRQEMVATMRRRGVRFVGRVERASRTSPASDGERASLVVLPFDNMTGDPARQHLADGMTEEVTARIARLPRVLVASRTSAFAYKERRLSAREIGRRLDVRYLIEGSVRASGDRLRVTAQLIDVDLGCHLWSASWNGEAADPIAVQCRIADDLSRPVANTIRAAERARRQGRIDRTRPSRGSTRPSTMSR